MNINHLRVNTLLRQSMSSFNRLPYHMTCCENRNILPLIQHQCLPDFKWHVFWDKNGPFWTTKTQITRAIVFGNRHSGSLGLIVITRIDDHHSWQHLHQPKIFQNLVRCSILSQRQPRMRSTNLHILMTVSHTLPNLIIHAACCEIRKSSSKRNFTARSQTCRCANHVRLRNPRLNETLREFIFEGIHHQRTR